MKTANDPRSENSSSGTHAVVGVTRIEVLAILAATALLAAVGLPALANHGERSARLICFGNLRQIGQAFQQWSFDHENRMPWQTPWWEGGTGSPSGSVPPPGSVPPIWYLGGVHHSEWFHFFSLSNELGSPRILACPADSKRRQAIDWTRSSDEGFLQGSYRNNALSYFLSLDAIAQNPLSLVSGDMALRLYLTGGGGGCWTGIRYNAEYQLPLSGPDPLFPQAHGAAGNFLFLDGHVEELSNHSAEIRFQSVNIGIGPHLLIPN